MTHASASLHDPRLKAQPFWSFTVRLRGKYVVSSVGGNGTRAKSLSRAHSVGGGIAQFSHKSLSAGIVHRKNALSAVAAAAV